MIASSKIDFASVKLFAVKTRFAVLLGSANNLARNADS